MRTYIFLGLAIAMSISAARANAQTQKGNWYIGASAGLGGVFGASSGESNTLGYGISSQNGSKETVFSFSPRIGYFLGKNWMAGLNLNVLINSDEAQSDNTVKFGPSLRWYGGEGKIRALLEGSIAIGSSRQGEQKRSHLGFSAGPGVAWLLNERMSLDVQALAEYDSRKLKGAENRIAAHRFGLRVGLGLFL